jgi:hypothetical protein
MKIKITIDTDSDAFQSNPRELRNLLESAATKINAFGRSAHGRGLMDSNGNKVGEIEIEERETGTKPATISM